MVEKVDLVQQNNYTTINSIRNTVTKPAAKQSAPTPSFTATIVPLQVNNPNTQVKIRTELSGKEEKQKYTEVLSQLDRSGKKTINHLLKTGVLLNANSNDNSTVLDNLYKIATEPRAEGLNAKTMLKDTIQTIATPQIITQQFGDIPSSYRDKALSQNLEGKTNIIDINQGIQDIDVVHSGTCVAASTEFKLAKQLPAEFARFAAELSSPKMSVQKTIKLNNLADETLNSIWLLNAFEVPWDKTSFETATMTFAPDKNALLRAQIQTTD